MGSSAAELIGVEAYASEPAADLLAILAEGAGDRGDIAVVFDELAHELSAKVGEAAVGGAQGWRGGRIGDVDGFGEIAERDGVALGERERGGERILELADVEAKRMTEQRTERVRLERQAGGA